MNKHILVIGSLPPPYGGGEIMMENVLTEMKASGFRTSHINTSIHYYNKDRTRISIKLAIRYFWIYTKLVKHLMFDDVDYIYFSLSKKIKGFIRNIPYIVFSKLFNTRVIGHIHGGEFDIVRLSFVAELVNMVDVVLVLSEEVNSKLSKVLNTKIATITNGIKVRDIRSQSRESIKNIVFVGNLTPLKGIYNLGKIYNEILSHNNKVKLILIGEWHSEKERNSFFKLVKNTHRNIVEAGYIPNNEVLYYLTECDLMIYPSVYDGQPISIIEALSQGIPVIASNVGGISLLIKNNYNGYLVNDYLSPDSFVKYAINIMQDAYIYNKFSINAINYYRNMLTEKKFGQQFRRVLYSQGQK